MTTVTAHICAAVVAVTCQFSEVRIVDGDTFAIASERVRIEGIDTPEIDGKCQKEQALALAAKLRLAQIIDGSTVVLERTGTDRYKRTLATVTADGADVGTILVSEGLARVWEAKWRPEFRDWWCR